MIEMLVTLTLFAMVLIVITNLLATSLRFMQSIGGSDSSKSSGILFAKLLDKTLRDAYSVTETNGFYMIDAFDDRRYAARIVSNRIVLSQLWDRNWEVLGDFRMETAKEISLDVIDSGGRRAVHFLAVYPDGSIDKTMILGYRKSVEDVNE